MKKTCVDFIRVYAENKAEFTAMVQKYCTEYYNVIRKGKESMHDFSPVSENEFFDSWLKNDLKHNFNWFVANKCQCGRNVRQYRKSLSMAYFSCYVDYLIYEIGHACLSAMNTKFYAGIAK